MTATRRYRPGGNKRYIAGKLSDDCVAFCRVFWGSFKLYVKTKEKETDTPSEAGPNVVLMFTPDQKPMISVDLTALTQQELVVLGEFFEFAGGLIQSLIRHRDEEAARAYAEGDDTFIRSYRPVPQLVVRDGPLGQHSEGLLIGPEGIPGKLGQRHSPGPDGRIGDAVARAYPTEHVTEDDDPQVDQP